MPNRIIREGFLDSEAIDSLSDSAECFYHRLLLAADDAGRFDSRPLSLRSKLYPLESSRRIQDVEAALNECEGAGLLSTYVVDGKAYLQIMRWQRCGRAEWSKFPAADGSYKIEYVEKETRDGVKSFVIPSVSADPISTPSAWDKHGVSMGNRRESDGKQTDTNTETETETETETGTYTESESETQTGNDSPSPPLAFANGEWRGIDDRRRSLWRKSYPDVDVGRELSRAAAWRLDHPDRTYKDDGRFLAGWLRRAQTDADKAKAEAIASGAIPAFDRRNPTEEEIKLLYGEADS